MQLCNNFVFVPKYIQNLRLKDTKKSAIIILRQKSNNFNKGDWV